MQRRTPTLHKNLPSYANSRLDRQKILHIIVVFTKTNIVLFMSHKNPIQRLPHNLRFILTLSFNPGFQGIHSQPKITHSFLIYPTRATCPANLFQSVALETLK
jgi:hypothetical protein